MITASLVSGQAPQLVQIVIDEVPAGVDWVLTGSVGGYTDGLPPSDSLAPGPNLLPADTEFVSGEYDWVVPGGRGVGDGGQVVLVDNRSPGNTPYVYTLTTSAGVERSNSVMVPFSRDIVLQTLDGQATVDVDLMAGSLGLEWPTNVATFKVPGRPRPVVRYDGLNDSSAAFVVKVPMANTPGLRSVLTSGAPIVYRFGGDSFDLPPVGVVAVTAVQSEAVPTAGLRFWTLGYTLVDDPAADVRLGAFSWDAFNDSRAGLSWSSGFDAQFAGRAWDQFDAVDWLSL